VSGEKPLRAPTYFCNLATRSVHAPRPPAALPLHRFLPRPLHAPLCSTRFSARSAPLRSRSAHMLWSYIRATKMQDYEMPGLAFAAPFRRILVQKWNGDVQTTEIKSAKRNMNFPSIKLWSQFSSELRTVTSCIRRYLVLTACTALCLRHDLFMFSEQNFGTCIICCITKMVKLCTCD